MQYKIVVHYAELALKGKNRNEFVKRLRKNMRKKLASIGHDWEVKSIHDRIFVEVGEVEESVSQQALTELARVPGIAWMSLVHWFDEQKYRFLRTSTPELQPIHDLITKLANQYHVEGHSFAVRVKRSDKNFSMSSQDFERALVTTIFQTSPWKSVNLKHADQFFYVDVSSRGTAVHLNKVRGTGGLPVSSTGRVLTLLSGGFDSPVAAWLMANRGCNVDFIHFSASHHNINDVEEYKIARIVKQLSEVTGRSRVFIVPYTHFDMALLEQDLDYDLILFRRFMARVSERIMDKIEAGALVTGDNLGQVASQTLENINSMNRAIDAPILRPLLTYNKEEIIAKSTELDLFDLCREPYKDCCALISKSPRTKSKHAILDKMEREHLSNYEELIQDTLDETTTLVYHFGQLVFKKDADDEDSYI